MSDNNGRGEGWGERDDQGREGELGREPHGGTGGRGGQGGRGGRGQRGERGETGPAGVNIPFTAREEWELDLRIQADVRKTWAGWLAVKPDDEAAFLQFAEMLKERRARNAFWSDIKSRSLSGVLVALTSAAVVWLASNWASFRP